MSGRYRGNGKTAKLLEKLLKWKKHLILCALAAVGLVYILSLMFGTYPYLFSAAVRPPVMGLAAFIAAFLALGILMVLPFCSPGAMDFAVLGCVGIGTAMLLWGMGSGAWALLAGVVSDASSVGAEGAGLLWAACVIQKIRE